MSSSIRGFAQGLIKGLPTSARSALQGELGSSSRSLHSDRYSPMAFSREAPLDVSSTWLPKNPFVESWVHKRNQLHEQFSWNTRNTVEVGYLLVGLITGAYAFGTWTMRASDAANGYPKRDLVFSG